MPGVWVAARGTTETKSLPSRIEISMRRSGTAVQLRVHREAASAGLAVRTGCQERVTCRMGRSE